MSNRVELQTVLEELLGSETVYFQPPASVQLKYPAIVYSLANIRSTFANDQRYKNMKAYTATLIDKNPDSEFVDKILALPLSSFDRHFKSDNLNHYVFTLYYKN